jgi:DNA repair exonuclease SbcCD ATPase subunit
MSEDRHETEARDLVSMWWNAAPMPLEEDRRDLVSRVASALRERAASLERQLHEAEAERDELRAAWRTCDEERLEVMRNNGALAGDVADLEYRLKVQAEDGDLALAQRREVKKERDEARDSDRESTEMVRRIRDERDELKAWQVEHRSAVCQVQRIREECDALQEANTRVAALVEAIQRGRCPDCDARSWTGQVHLPDCRVAPLLKGTKQ